MACHAVGNGRRAHGFDEAAADLAHDVDVVRALIEHRTARRFELGQQPRPVIEFVEVPGVDRAQRTDATGLHQLGHRDDRRIEAVRMAGEQYHAGALRRLDHLDRILERQGQRLLADDILAMRRCRLGMFEMQPRGRCDVDRVDIGIAAEFRCIGIGAAAEFRRETLLRLLARIGARRDRPGQIGRGTHLVDDHCAGLAEADDAETRF